jgi:uncharacterized protein (TIGR03663 family)
METTSTLPSNWLDVRLWRWVRPNIETLLAGLILLAAVLSRFYDLGQRAMSHDEINHVVPSYEYARGLGYRYDPITHGPLQFHLMALSFFMLGDNDFSARIPAAIFSVATIGIALFAFRTYLGRAGALAAGLMLLISPTMLFYGRYARNEAFIVVWGLLSIYAILRYLERGETGCLILFTLVNALHFTDKTTAYIYAAQQLVFLGAYFIYRVNRQAWLNPSQRSRFWTSLLAAAALLGVAGMEYFSEKASFGMVGWMTLLPLAAGVAAGSDALVHLARGLGWQAMREERSFDLLLLLGSLVLPLLGALPVSLLGGDAQDISAASLLRDGGILAVLALASIGLGLVWGRRIWWACAGLFYGIFILLYTSLFSNPTGLATGLFGGLGYWITQQAVQRGDQPLYYYALLQIPVYEFLPALGAIPAVLIAWKKHLWQASEGQPFVREVVRPNPLRNEGFPSAPFPDSPTGARSAGKGEKTKRFGEIWQRFAVKSPHFLLLPFPPKLGERGRGIEGVPTMALGLNWAASSLLIFSFAGEKMPWLAVNIALPLILVAAWGIGFMVEKADQRGWQRLALAVFGLLALLSLRTAWRAAFILYDDPLEYLVYAHSAPDPKRLLAEIEDLSRRTAGGLDMVVAYDNYVRYPYWWYLRDYPNRQDFGETPGASLRQAAVIFAGAPNYSLIERIVRDDYLQYDYTRMWWPNMDYWGLKWSTIAAERQAELAAAAVAPIPPMSVPDYAQRAWQKIWTIASDPAWRNAVWQIWFNRNYQPYALLKGSASFDLANWSPSERMRMYVRKDVAARAWGPATAVTTPAPDPYAGVKVSLAPIKTIGTAGSGAGQFQAPRGLALAPDGSLYAADARNNRVQHFTADGQHLGMWGTYANIAAGAAPGGTFNEPWGVAVGPGGEVYVADTWNHRVQKFSADGQFVRMWGVFGQGSQPGELYGPRGIAVDAQGNVLVVDSGNKRVVVYNPDGQVLATFGGAGAGPGQMDEPVGIALGSNGSIYVADTWNQRIQVFGCDSVKWQCQAQSSWEIAGWYGQSLENKPFLAAGSRGQIYASDPEGCRILEFSSNGAIARTWGSCAENGELAGLVAGPNNTVWASDVSNQRLLAFRLP